MALKTQYKHIYFENVSDSFPKRKTQTWVCCNNSGIFLGVVAWNNHWRQYWFYIEDGCGFSIGCMKDTINFIEQLNEERKCQKK